MVSDDQTWFDEDAGPLVRPYAVTRGRTHSEQRDLELITLVVAVAAHPSSWPIEPEYANIMALCQRPTSIAELSAHLALPLGVVRVLLGDLIERRLIIFRSAVTPDTDVLQAVLDGIRRL